MTELYFKAGREMTALEELELQGLLGLAAVPTHKPLTTTSVIPPTPARSAPMVILSSGSLGFVQDLQGDNLRGSCVKTY